MTGAPAHLQATVLGAPEEQFGRILEPTDPRSRSVTEIADESSETLDRIGEALGSGLLSKMMTIIYIGSQRARCRVDRRAI